MYEVIPTTSPAVFALIPISVTIRGLLVAGAETGLKVSPASCQGTEPGDRRMLFRIFAARFFKYVSMIFLLKI